MDPIKPKPSAKILAAISGVPRNARRVAARSTYYRVTPMVAASASEEGAVVVDGETVVPAQTSYVIDSPINGITPVRVPVTTTMREARHVEDVVSKKLDGAPVLVLSENVCFLRVEPIDDINAVLKGEDADAEEVES